MLESSQSSCQAETLSPALASFRESVRDAFGQRKLEGRNLDGLSVFAFESLDSTMNAVTRYQNQPEAFPSEASCCWGPEEPTSDVLIIAKEQSAGRGRFEREWHSSSSAGGAAGGIYVSFLLRFSDLSYPLSSFSLVAGLAVQKTLAEFGLRAWLKWPNDVLVLAKNSTKYKKICGLLAEAGTGADTGLGLEQWVNLGIGLNVSQKNFPENVPGISMVQALGETPDYFFVLASLAAEVLDYKKAFEAQGFAALKEAWWAGSLMSSAVIRLPNDSGSYIASGIGDEGGLEIRDENGAHKRVHSGEIEIEGY